MFNLQIHTPPDAFGDWVTLSPPINSRTKFWGNSFSDSNAPPATTTFAVDQIVTVCFKTRLVVDNHKGFSASITDTTTTPTTVTTSTTSKPTTAQDSVNKFSSPNYPNNFPPNVDDCWVQTPTDGHAVTLTIIDFDVRTFCILNCSSYY